MIPPQDVRQALAQIVASDGFVNAPQLCRFITFAVERQLAGEGDQLKEYLLGSEVFDRGADFDPRLDPIVRVEARRLRTKLQEYYERSGKDAAVRIVFTKGSYAPEFLPNSAPPVTTELVTESIRPKRPWGWAIALAALLATGAFVLRVATVPPTPEIVVMPYASPEDQGLADGLAESIAIELSHNPKIRVKAWPLFVEYRRTHNSPSAKEAAAALGTGLVVAVSVRNHGGDYSISATVMNPNQGWKKWAGEYQAANSMGLKEQKQVAQTIAGEVARLVLQPGK